MVVTGPSGSGKTSLVFDTLYKEAQRRFLRLRNIQKLEAPAVESISGLSFAVGIEAKAIRLGKANLARLSAIDDYLKLLFFHLSESYCLNCGSQIICYRKSEIFETLLSKDWQEVKVFSPLLSFEKNEIDEILSKGFTRARAEDGLKELELIEAGKRVEVFIDQISAKADELRIREALDLALELSDGDVLFVFDKQEEVIFSQKKVCLNCNTEQTEERLVGCSENEVFAKTINKAREWLDQVPWQAKKSQLGELLAQCVKELSSRLECLKNLGLGYLQLDRPLGTLSTGELQRVQLARQLSNKLSGVLYLIDEPSRGLHPADVQRLINSLRSLIDEGGSLIAVEHNPLLIGESDFLIELGPGGGERGGEIVESGKLTLEIKLEENKKDFNSFISFKGLKKHNLKNLSFELPLNGLVTFTGVSGSGKSSLLVDSILPVISRLVRRQNENLADFEIESIEGWQNVEAVVDGQGFAKSAQSRSNVASLTGLNKALRALYSQTIQAKIKGLEIKDFVFENKLELKSVLYKGLSFFDACSLSVSEALERFQNIPQLKEVLFLMKEVGLEYLKLSQSALSLSSGELQRIRLVRELAKKRQKKTLYIFDEPTRGLSEQEVVLLLKVFRNLLAQGHSIFAIEHNLSFIKASDFLVDLGPGAGEAGGEILAAGTLEELKKSKRSTIAKFLN